MDERENVVDVTEEVVDEKQVDANEDKHQKFYRISLRRIQAAAKQLDLLGNCASSDYEYTEEDVAKMFDYLQQALDDTKAKYEKKEISVFNW